MDCLTCWACRLYGLRDCAFCGGELRVVTDNKKRDPLQALHQQAFLELPAQVAEAPGRVEFLGGSTAQEEGLVLAVAIDRKARAGVSPRRDGRVDFVWDGGEGRASFWLHELGADPGDAPPVRWIKSVLRELRRRKVHFSGFNLSVHSSIPPGLGLGEEAASTVAVLAALRRQYPYSLTLLGAGEPPRRDARGRVPGWSADEKRILVEWCKSIWESSPEWGGEAFDPWPSLFAKEWHVLATDCRFQRFDQYRLVGEALVVVELGVGANAEQSEWHGGWSRLCRETARLLMAKTLRSVDPAYLRVNGERLNGTQAACARHVAGELQRVVYAERALRDEDIVQFGHYLTLSQESFAANSGASSPLAESVDHLARSLPGCHGGRLLGPGHGSSMLFLVAYHEVVAFVEQLAERCAAEVGSRPKISVLPMADGAAG